MYILKLYYIFFLNFNDFYCKNVNIIRENMIIYFYVLKEDFGLRRKLFYGNFGFQLYFFMLFFFGLKVLFFYVYIFIYKKLYLFKIIYYIDYCYEIIFGSFILDLW